MMKRALGQQLLNVEPLGLGCMGLSEFYGPPTEERVAIALLHEAMALGVDHFDTAESYGVGSANEILVGKALTGRRESVVLATKFGPMRDPVTGVRGGLDGTRTNCRRAVEGSLRRLGTSYIDLYYLHRVDPNTPIEVTVAAMAELVAEGKVRAIGLSEASGDTIRRAAKVHSIAAVQSEYSIFSRDIEGDVLPACREVGATLVAYSPLGRGMLTGQFTADSKPGDTDFRGLMQPRFAGSAYAANLALVQEIGRVAEAAGAGGDSPVLPSQVALALVLARGQDIVAIPGTTKSKNLRENLGAYRVELNASQLERLNQLADQVQGTRYDAAGMARLNG